MKKMIACLLACLLCALALIPAVAEQDPAWTPYDLGGLEMLRQYWVRAYNPAYQFTFNRNGTEEYPTGVILDEDEHRVLVVAEDTVLTLMLSGQEGDMDVTAGYAVYEALFALDEDMVIWRRSNGAFEAMTLDDMGFQLRAYLDLTGYRRLQYWTSLRRVRDDPQRDVSGRILGNRGCACVVTDVELCEELMMPDLGDSIVLMEDENILMVQSRERSYLFTYTDGYEEAMMGLTVFNVLMGGVEVEDMLALRVAADPEDPESYAVFLMETEELFGYLDHFYENWDLGLN